MNQNTNTIIVESSIESIEQFPAKLYEQLLPIINNDDSFKEFLPKLNAVYPDAVLDFFGTDYWYNLALFTAGKPYKNYYFEYTKIENKQGIKFAIHVTDSHEPGLEPDLYYDFFVMYVKDIKGVITTKSLPEQYEYFCQQFFNKVNKTLSKAFTYLKSKRTRLIVISTLKQMASKIQEKILRPLQQPTAPSTAPSTAQPTAHQRANTTFKDFYDAL